MRTDRRDSPPTAKRSWKAMIIGGKSGRAPAKLRPIQGGTNRVCTRATSERIAHRRRPTRLGRTRAQRPAIVGGAVRAEARDTQPRGLAHHLQLGDGIAAAPRSRSASRGPRLPRRAPARARRSAPVAARHARTGHGTAGGQGAARRHEPLRPLGHRSLRDTWRRAASAALISPLSRKAAGYARRRRRRADPSAPAPELGDRSPWEPDDSDGTGHGSRSLPGDSVHGRPVAVKLADRPTLAPPDR